MTLPLPRRAVAGLLAALCLFATGARAEGPWPTRYIAALGDADATAGTGAEAWGLWELDPGPRGVRLDGYPALAAAGTAPAGWRFDPAAWWLEEHGLLMEAPSFPLPQGRYLVTGGREVVALLTVAPPDAAGHQSWSLDDGATLHDVTHHGCRAALYTARAERSCTPDTVNPEVFPMTPGTAMPAVDGCAKQDYQVLIVVGRLVDSEERASLAEPEVPRRGVPTTG